MQSNGEQKRKPGNARCFNCRGTGHFAKNCPLHGHVAPVESQGRTTVGGKSPSNNLAALVPGSDIEERIQTQLDDWKSRVADLR